MQRLPQRRTHVIAIGCRLLMTSAARPRRRASRASTATPTRCTNSPPARTRRRDLTCVDCHGGDPKTTDETAHVTDNFRSPNTKQGIAELCASCHSDVRRMNPYGLPTDQLERYKTSKHGEQLFEHNDQNVAVCIDCHGVHDILSPQHRQPRLSNQRPQTCGRCHGNEKLMEQYKLPSDIVAQYKTSYHATMLFEKGDFSAPTCVTCHGSHGASPPGTAQVGEVCGKCHVRQRELFAKSPHAEAAAAGLFSECVSCHGNHAIQKASVDLFAQSLRAVSRQGSEATRRPRRFATLIRDSQNDYDTPQRTCTKPPCADWRPMTNNCCCRRPRRRSPNWKRCNTCCARSIEARRGAVAEKLCNADASEYRGPGVGGTLETARVDAGLGFPGGDGGVVLAQAAANRETRQR